MGDKDQRCARPGCGHPRGEHTTSLGICKHTAPVDPARPEGRFAFCACAEFLPGAGTRAAP